MPFLIWLSVIFIFANIYYHYEWINHLPLRLNYHDVRYMLLPFHLIEEFTVPYRFIRAYLDIVRVKDK